MKQKIIAMMVFVCMLCSCVPAVSMAADDTTIFISAEDFGDNVGTWTLANRDAGAFGYVLRASGGGRPENSKNAEIHINLPETATYTVWVRTRDYKAGVDANGNEIKAGERLCQIQVGDTRLEKDLGAHGQDAFAWEEAGTVELQAGETSVILVDTTANYARVEAIALSVNAKLVLPDTQAALTAAYETYAPEIIAFEGEDAQTDEVVVNPVLPDGEKPAAVSTYFLGADSFAGHLGTWLAPGKDGSVLPVLRSPGGQNPEKTSPAISSFELTQEGVYYLWAWSRDYADGARTFKIAVDGNITERELGAHGLNGWAWEYCGKLEMDAGTIQVEVIDSKNNYGRLQGIVITNDPTYVPEETEAVAKNQVKANMSASYTSNITGVIANPNIPQGDFEFNPQESYIVVTSQDFNEANLGSWTLSSVSMGSVMSQIVMSASDGREHLSDPAVFPVVIPKTGIYKVMVHSNDAPSNSGRKFKVQVGDTAARECGQHGLGWGWESFEVPVVAGETELKIIDHTGNYGRFDMIVITSDTAFEVQETRNNLLALADLAKNRPTDFEIQKDADRPADEIAVNLNGAYMTFDVPPVLINDRTMVPFRAIFEALGCIVQWDDATQTATGTRNGKKI